MLGPGFEGDGYPLAYTAAKLALGHTLPELPNAVTKTTTSLFRTSWTTSAPKSEMDLAKFPLKSTGVGLDEPL